MMRLWRTYTALTLLFLAAVGLSAGSFLPVLGRNGEGSVPLWGVLILHPLLGTVAGVILVSYSVLIGVNLVRLFNVNVRGILTQPTLLTPIVSLLGLGYGDLEDETTRVSLLLSGLLFAALVLLGVLPQLLTLNLITGDGYGAMLFFSVIPIAAMAAACHPRLRVGIAPRQPVLRARMFLDVRHGRLVGARPQIDPPPFDLSETTLLASTPRPPYGQPGLFSIGRGEDNDLVLFDENPQEVLDTHACVFFPDLKPTLRAYGPILINDQPFTQPGDHPLKHKVKFQIGQTVIRFFIEPLT